MFNVKRLGCTLSAAMVCLLAGFTDAKAQNGNPHTLTGDVTFSNVTLNWQAPASDIKLQWHNDYDYNGTDGVQSNPQSGVVYYVASKFTKEELKGYVGEVVDSLSFFQYRPSYKVTGMIYEDGTPVLEQPVDLTGFEKNTMRKFALSTPYTIPADKEIMFVMKYEYGYNQEMMAICDESPTIGKGNLTSLDGKTWSSNGPGDYLITAYVKNNDKQSVPDGYNVYRDGVKVNAELITETTYSLQGEADGKHDYYVTAVYGDTEKKSVSLTFNCTAITSHVPAVSSLKSSVEDLNGTLEWTAPLSRSSELTWSNKEFGTTIGGTSSTPKVWVKQEFDANDLIAYPNHKITAINAYTKGALTGVTIFVIKNGVIDYHQVIDEAVVKAMGEEGAWTKFTLTTPYKFEAGNKYAFGCYFTHDKGVKPIATDNSVGLNKKGNSFSTSSPKSSGFEASNPSWKTLAEGSIPGNFMLTADMEAVGEETSAAPEIAGYDIYRNGALVAADVKELKYTDTVEDLGTYCYGVVAKGKDGRLSPVKEIDVTYTLPAAYEAPVILSSTIDENNKLDLTYSAEAIELKHYDAAAYMAGFAEEMPDLLYGAKFTKEELAGCVGYELNSLKFAIGEGLSTFHIEVYESGNPAPIYSEEMKDIEPGYVYTTNPSSKITIPADKDLYLVYKATLPANKSAIIVDAGPAVDNGAVVSLTGGANWFKLGTIAPDLKDYNIVISGIAVPATSGSRAKAVVLGAQDEAFENLPEKIVAKAKEIDYTADEFGVESAVKPAKKAARLAPAKPKALSYRVYCNNEVVQDGESTSYTEVISNYGVFNYHVTAVYEKGWESPASRVISITNDIKQAPAAPYDLAGEEGEEGFNLTWKAASESPVLKVHSGNIDWKQGCGMTSSNNSGFQVMKFDASQVADKVGMEISHIRFGLIDNNVTSASVIVMKNENVIYEQEVDIETLVVGWNEVRLNNPVTIEAGQDLYVGYHLTYKKGVKPMAGDAGPAVAGYGDLISSSGSNGYWYSLMTKYKLDFNWVIEAVLKKPDTKMASRAKRAADAVTYNVYCNGKAVATGLETTTYAVAKGAYGRYTVTAVTGEVESAESNAINYGTATGITGVEDAKAAVSGVYSIDGKMINENGTTEGLKKGLHIVNGKKIITK